MIPALLPIFLQCNLEIAQILRLCGTYTLELSAGLHAVSV